MTGATINDEKELPARPVEELSLPVVSIKDVDRAGGEDEEDSLPTPTMLSLDSSVTSSSSSSSTSSSPSISPSSSIATDTSVASDTSSQGVPVADKHARERHKVDDRAPRLADDDNTIVSTLNPDVGNVDSATINTNTTAITISTPASESSTPASSSSTSLPGPTPFSSSTPSSTSPSTTNVNDPGGGDLNYGLMSLLRPRPQMSQNLNVKFAPLPELAPRKRKSSTPLGMAARSQLARRRRMMYQDSYDDDELYEESYRPPPPRRMIAPEISEEEDLEGDASQKKKKSKKKKEGDDGERKEKKLKKEGEVEEEEDPLAALAKKMGRAGKHLWRKMASSGKVEKIDGGDDAKRMKAGPVVIIGAITSELGDERQREGDSAVWNEEVEDQCRRLQEMRVNGSIEAEASLRQATSTPLPPSDPPTPIDTTPATTTQAPDGSFPTPPTIVVSAA